MPRCHRKIPPLTPQDIERFWKNVDKTPGQGPKGKCWIWVGCRSDSNYGLMSISSKAFRASRISYFLHYSVDPGALLVCHHCDFPPCVRPEDLFIDSDAGNHEDARNKGRYPTGDEHFSRRRPECNRYGDDHWTHRLPGGVADWTAKMLAAQTPEKVARGSQLPQTRFSPEQVRQIRRRYEAKEATISGMAREEHASTHTIFCIVHRKTHKNVI